MSQRSRAPDGRVLKTGNFACGRNYLYTIDVKSSFTDSPNFIKYFLCINILLFIQLLIIISCLSKFLIWWPPQFSLIVFIIGVQTSLPLGPPLGGLEQRIFSGSAIRLALINAIARIKSYFYHTQNFPVLELVHLTHASVGTSYLTLW